MFEAVFPGAQLFPVLFYPEKYSCECVIMMGCMCVYVAGGPTQQCRGLEY